MRTPTLALLFTLVPAAALVGQSAPHRVLAFYYDWYGTPRFEQGRWVHWDECRGCRHDPARTVAETSPRTGTTLKVPDTGTTDHPPALYDSNDPIAIRRHLRLAARAGIDALIATWWGRGSYHDRAFRTALAVAHRARSRVKLTIYYETVPDSAGDRVQAVVDDFRYLRERYGRDPAFLHVDGKPVFFIYGRALHQLTPQQWLTALAGIRALGPSILIGDCTAKACLDVFDGLHEYNPVGEVAAHADLEAQFARLAAICRERGRISAATVIPGYDDSHIGRDHPTVVGREGGALYSRLWHAAMRARADWVLITSFNEWHEGSEIEPSVEWGDRFIDSTRVLSREFKRGR